jgi:hypothetical protein
VHDRAKERDSDISEKQEEGELHLCKMEDIALTSYDIRQ